MISAALYKSIILDVCLALLLALGLAGWQWSEAVAARADAASVRLQFAEYRETQERQARQALEKLRVEKARSDKIRQEAIDAEFLARQSAEADAARLRASHGQLQRYAEDLATSLGRAAGDPAIAGRCEAAVNELAVVVGALDGFAEEAATAADSAIRAGQLCERTHDALTPPSPGPGG